jgi:hypothetical protein
MRTFAEWTRHANAYLPLRGEDRRQTAEDVVAHRIKFAKTPIFSRTNSMEFWYRFYDDWSRSQMMEQARVLDLHTWPTMSTLKLKRCLSTYWIMRLNGETFVPSSIK